MLTQVSAGELCKPNIPVNTPGNFTYFLIDSWNFHMFFLQYPWKFHILNLPSPAIRLNFFSEQLLVCIGSSLSKASDHSPVFFMLGRLQIANPNTNIKNHKQKNGTLLPPSKKKDHRQNNFHQA